MEEETSEIQPPRRLRLCNHILTVVAILLGLYIIVTPFLPEIVWWVGENTPIKTYADNAQSIETAANDPSSRENRLYIPRLGMNELIHEGGLEQLKKGILRRDHTSTPAQGSNTVIVGHRFAYGNRGVFYHLDKIRISDPIIAHWNGQVYRYVVSEVIVVPPTQASVEEPTSENILTLYTCTPLWSAKDRLVVKAKLESEDTQ